MATDSSVRRALLPVAMALILLLGPGLAPALAAEATPRDWNTYRPSVPAVRAAPGQAPTIDGDLSDPAWANATLIEEFFQLDPPTGEPASERTAIRVMYDDENLYFAIYAYDRNPEEILATIKQRDGTVGNDDFVRIYLDPNLTRRDSYMFEINPLGTRTDALGQNSFGFLKEWTMIWSAASKRTAEGWFAEAAIPFRSLSYDPAQSDWGFDFQRNIRRKGERVRWSSIVSSLWFTDVSRAGTLTGIRPVRNDLGLDIQTFERVSFKHDWQAAEREDPILGRFGANAFYKIVPTLTGTLTVNPDFSDAPLDQRQLNLTRFALFQPETRDFFLQDAATFEYGGRGFVNADNARPFFSRNIGLANGRPVSIIAGGKVSGTYGGLGVGALSVLTSGTGLNNRGQVLSVARLTAPVFDESKAGIIVTNGDPNGASRNTVVGTDFQYRSSNWFPGQTLQSDLYYQRSFSGALGEDDAFGGAITFPNEPVNAELAFKQVGANFNPALGFANRKSIRNYTGKVTYRDRTLGWRWFDLIGQSSFVTDLNNALQSSENGVSTGIQSNSLDQIYVRAFHLTENVPATFNLPRSVPVPLGSYSWYNFGLRVETNNGRRFSTQVDLTCCSFYNGDYFRAEISGNLRFNETFQMGPRYIGTFIDLPTGAVDVYIISSDILINFTPDMSLLTQVQFDNISDNFGMSARYSWEYSPGQEVFAAFVKSALIPGRDFKAQTSEVSVRLGQTLRF